MHASRVDGGWERLFWLVFDRTSNPIALLDDERRIVEVNDAAVKLFRRSPEEVMGRPITDFLRADERPLARRAWERFLSSGEYSGTRDMLLPDGTDTQIEFAARLAEVGGRRLAIYVALETDGSSAHSIAARVSQLPLTVREREVVTLIALGHETAQIAQELHISVETVRTHVRNAMSKLGAHTRAQLVAVVLTTEQAVHRDHLPSPA
jgi:PAS domain S-box-containing protein